jgi:MOSC domain-containing protein
MTTLARISVSPVKGFRLRHPNEVFLDLDGVAGNRCFFVVDEDGQRLRSSATPWLALVGADYDAEQDELTVHLPDGSVVAGSAAPSGVAVHSTVGSLEIRARVVDGPWAEPLSGLAAKPVRLVRADRGETTAVAPVTLVSDGSLARVAREAGVASLDSRRFRMLFELAGCRAHEEDEWGGRPLQVGDARVRVGTGVVRCAVTTRDPETAERDLDILRHLADYRGRGEDGGVLFGVYATVEHPGRVRVGDAVAPA